MGVKRLVLLTDALCWGCMSLEGPSTLPGCSACNTYDECSKSTEPACNGTQVAGEDSQCQSRGQTRPT
eukprot:129795-Amphidinium_carterae.1